MKTRKIDTPNGAIASTSWWPGPRAVLIHGNSSSSRAFSASSTGYTCLQPSPRHRASNYAWCYKEICEWIAERIARRDQPIQADNNS